MPKTTKPKAPGAPQLLGFLQTSAKLMKAEEIADELGYKTAEGIEAVRALLDQLIPYVAGNAPRRPNFRPPMRCWWRWGIPSLR